MSPALRVERWLAALLRSERGRQLCVLTVLALALAGLLVRLGAGPIVRSGELRTFAVAGHSVATHEWLVPIDRGAVRLQKPPLYYWAATAIALPSGRLTPFALRLPAALSAWALLCVVFCWGRSLGGFSAGAIAMLSLLAMAQFWSIGRRGVAEMPLVFFATLALFLFDAIRWRGRRRLIPGFFAALLGAFLAKASVALLLVGLPLALQRALDGSLRRAPRRHTLAWAAACAVACLTWYFAVWWRVPGATAALREALLLPLGLAASIGSSAHVRPFWFYTPQLLAVTSPAVCLALVAWRSTGHAREVFADPSVRFPLQSAVALLLAFSLIPMKQKHYLLPLLPLLAVAQGQLVAQLVSRDPAPLLAHVRSLGWLAFVLAPLVALLLGAHLLLSGDAPSLLALGVGALLMLAGALCFDAARRGCLRAFAAASVLFAATTLVTYEASVRGVRERFRDEGSAALAQASPRLQAMLAEHSWLRSLYGLDAASRRHERRN